MMTKDPPRWRTVVRIWPSGSVEIVDHERDDAAGIAALVAAAPDLLAACEDALLAMDAIDVGTSRTSDMLRAAIAKAKGGAP
jgi:hypothetical protein